MKKTLQICSMFLLLASCTTDEFMEYHVVGFKPQLGVAGYISNDSIYLCLTQTKDASTINPYEPQEYIPTLTDTTANVSIFENGNYFTTPGTRCEIYHKYVFSEPFQDVSETKLFYVSNKNVTPGNSYSIKIEDNTFGTIEAVTEVPLLSKVTFNDTLVLQKPSAELIERYPYCINPNDSLWYRVFTLSIYDLPKADNYYGLIIDYSKIHGVPFNDSTCSCVDFIFNDALIEFKPLNEFGNPINNYYFSDKLFNGQTHKLQFSFLNGNMDSCTVYFYQMSKEYYQYMESVYLYRSTQYDPFHKPVTIYSNTSNNIGIWGGYYKETFTNY
jgi:hypothetical protein